MNSPQEWSLRDWNRAEQQASVVSQDQMTWQPATVPANAARDLQCLEERVPQESILPDGSSASHSAAGTSAICSRSPCAWSGGPGTARRRPAVCVQGGHAARARRRDGLPVDAIRDVAVQTRQQFPRRLRCRTSPRCSRPSCRAGPRRLRAFGARPDRDGNETAISRAPEPSVAATRSPVTPDSSPSTSYRMVPDDVGRRLPSVARTGGPGPSRRAACRGDARA